MDSVTFRLRYRPIRIGWCLRAGDFEALRESLRESWLLCGGAHNPLIVVDDVEGASALVRSANVDLLLAGLRGPYRRRLPEALRAFALLAHEPRSICGWTYSKNQPSRRSRPGDRVNF